jgi:hypothetical protein
MRTSGFQELAADTCLWIFNLSAPAKIFPQEVAVKTGAGRGFWHELDACRDGS